LSPGHCEREPIKGVSERSLQRGSRRQSPRWGFRVRSPPPPEAESSVAFEAPVEEQNLILVRDSFLQFIWRNINVHITEIWRN